MEVKSSQVKSSQVKSSQVISAHSLPPLLASGAHSIGFRMVVCCLGIVPRLDLTRRGHHGGHRTGVHTEHSSGQFKSSLHRQSVVSRPHTPHTRASPTTLGLEGDGSSPLRLRKYTELSLPSRLHPAPRTPLGLLPQIRWGSCPRYRLGLPSPQTPVPPHIAVPRPQSTHQPETPDLC